MIANVAYANPYWTTHGGIYCNTDCGTDTTPVDTSRTGWEIGPLQASCSYHPGVVSTSSQAKDSNVDTHRTPPEEPRPRPENTVPSKHQDKHQQEIPTKQLARPPPKPVSFYAPQRLQRETYRQGSDSSLQERSVLL